MVYNNDFLCSKVVAQERARLTISRDTGEIKSMFLRLIQLQGFVGIAISLTSVGVQSALALPPPEDTPEEILRTEIILEARSPVDGKPLTAAQYAQLQAKLQTRPVPPKLSPKIRDNIFRLRLLKLFRTVLPFL